ncbi:MAG: PepSY domain-containing protein [Burkholderiaceae bacterium]|nr:PepSY domain-containing protein [Burkholderiaceae bacterium]
MVAVKDASRASPGDTVLAWLHPLHNGEALGLPGRLLVCAAGLIPALLFVTGWIRWRQKTGRGVSVDRDLGAAG